jgi:hypothetical protein
VALLVGAVCVSGCKQGATGTGAAPGSGSATALAVTGPAVEKAITAAAGGSIAVGTPEGAQARIVFPRGALAADSDIAVTALTGNAAGGTIVGGFSLEEKGSGAGPKLAGPAFVYFALKGAAPAGASIVSYRDDGSFDPVATTVSSKDGTSVLVAAVTHFSRYGVRAITAEQATAAKDASSKALSGFDWVVYVKDSGSVTRNGMKSTLALDLRAVNVGGDIAGSYSATGKGTAGNVWSGGLLVEKFTVKVAAFKFALNPYFAMVPLTEAKDDGELAPLDTQVDYQGYGTMTLTTSGSGEAHASGQTVAVPVKPKTSTAKFTVSVFGPELRMTVVDATGATFYLDGYVRGQGK